MDDAKDPVAYFASRGYEVSFEERDLHSELMASGDPGRASFHREGQIYFCVSLLRAGVVIASNYATGETEAEALISARRRFGSEQV